jgi:hypothetical protein
MAASVDSASHIISAEDEGGVWMMSLAKKACKRLNLKRRRNYDNEVGTNFFLSSYNMVVASGGKVGGSCGCRGTASGT